MPAALLTDLGTPNGVVRREEGGYLTWLFERMGTHRNRFGMAAKDLTPAAYKSAGCPGEIDAKLHTGA
jgi:hypothetical protein